ncbi:hypothetical protein FQA39_LY16761 [Lamprigera yunnana]|nr:hypothetical protein FQA39_LY16761 [Lamprigera yunnana]
MNANKSPLKYQHPFIDGLKVLPQNRSEDLVKVRTWMDQQPHLPHISDEYIYLFLHACYYDHEKTKHTIETYFTIRGNSPAIFSNRDPFSESMEYISSLGLLMLLPHETSEGYKVLLYVIKENASTEYVFSDAVKAFCMFNDCILSEDGLAEGYIVIFDMKNLRFGHLAHLNLYILRTFMVYIQEAHPARLKAIHVINTMGFIKNIMRILQPMMRSELMGLLKFHTGNVPDPLPQEMMPKDYGGDAPSFKELGEQVFKMRHRYAEWLKESQYFVSDETKRVRKNWWWSIFGGNSNTNNAESSEKSLSCDESKVFKSLEID